MQTPNPQRPEPRRQTPAYASGQVEPASHNERQLLARIAQLEAERRARADAIVLRPVGAPPSYSKYLPDDNAALSADGNSFQRRHDSEHGTTWFGDERRLDQHGREWARHHHAVIDDFGNLVEVRS